MKSDDRKTNAIQVEGEPGESDESLLARTALTPTVLAGISIKQLTTNRFTDLKLQRLIDELSNQVAATNEGDTDRSMEMLVAQAHTLDAVFHETLRRGCINFGEYPETAERYIKLGLKAQSQCRTPPLATRSSSRNADPDAADRTYGQFPCLRPDDVARAVRFVLSSPPHVQFHDLLVRPTQQPS